MSSDPQIMYVLQNSRNANGLSIVYRSEDGGATWEEKGSSNGIFSSAFNGDYNNTIFVDPLDVDVIYLGGVDMWKSVDQGVNFTRISDWNTHHTLVRGDLAVRDKENEDVS